MQDQKIEQLLLLALSATKQERERSLELNVGYESQSDQWDVIVKYTGSISGLQKKGIQVVELLQGYAVLTLREEQLLEVAQLKQIEYMEKPKRMYFQMWRGKQASCISNVVRSRMHLTGKGVLIGIVDSGIDYSSREFRRADGTSRIRSLWDQGGAGNPPKGYWMGTEYSRKEIDQMLVDDTKRSMDGSGHGTAVAQIAAGSTQGVATESEFVVVKLGNPRKDGFPRTTELMQGIDYVVRKAMEYEMPVAVNISFGNSYGSHDGSSLLERFIDEIAESWKCVICIGTGNEGASAGHVAGSVKEKTEVEFAIQSREKAFDLQVWKAYCDEMDISIVTPDGNRLGPLDEGMETQRFYVSGTELLVYYGEPSPYSIAQEIYMDFIPEEGFVKCGIWKICLCPKRIVSGEFAMWMPSMHVLNLGTAFLRPSASGTLTIPSTSERAIAVGAYDASTFSYADFSGRGRVGGGRRMKPDLVAPGVNVSLMEGDGSMRLVSGTSFATPFVTGAAALLMEWGIVEGNDPYLYGEKVKAYLQRGALHLPGIDAYPNERVGYGCLCLENCLKKY